MWGRDWGTGSPQQQLRTSLPAWAGTEVSQGDPDTGSLSPIPELVVLGSSAWLGDLRSRPGIVGKI